MTDLNVIIGDKKSAAKLKEFTDKYISNIHGQAQYIDDNKEIESEVKSELGLAPAEFKQLVKGLMENGKVEDSIKKLTNINNAINALDNMG